MHTFLDVLYGGLHVHVYMHAYIGETAKKHMWCSVCIKFMGILFLPVYVHM